jgi:hypothetical protein
MMGHAQRPQKDVLGSPSAGVARQEAAQEENDPRGRESGRRPDREKGY